MAPQGPPGMGPPGMGPPPPGGDGPGGPGGPGGPPGGKMDFSWESMLSSLSMFLKDCLLYAGIVQFILVAYMYIRVGKGRMWKIFFYSSLSLFIAQTVEHILITFTMFKQTQRITFMCYIPLEIFYIISEFSIPYINYLKLKAVTRRTYVGKIKYLLILAFPFYSTFRFLMGIYRYKLLDINPDIVRTFKGSSSAIIAVVDVIISILIIYELKQNLGMERLQNKYLNKTSVYTYIRKSNYAVLIMIDLCGFILTLLSFSFIIPSNMMDLVMPFQCLKDNFILILAVDAIIFKVDCFKMISSGKTVGNNLKGSYSNSYNGSSNNYINYSSNGYGNLSNFNSNVSNLSSSKVIANSQPLFSSTNSKSEFGTFHAGNALNKLEEAHNNYIKTSYPNFNDSNNDKKSYHYFNDIYNDSKASVAPLNPGKNLSDF